MTPERIDELISLAALGELTATEARELDAAVRRDPIIAAELDEALETAAALQKAQSEQPPTALRNKVLADIATTAQERASTRSAPGEGEIGPDSAEPVVVEFGPERRSRRARSILLAAAVVAMFALGGLFIVEANRSSDAIADVLDAPDARTTAFAGEITTLAVVYSASQDALVIQGSDVAVLDETSTYQLWLVDAGGATSVGTFRPDADGRVAQLFADVDPTGFELGVTKEPAGGSPSPTPPILASG